MKGIYDIIITTTAVNRMDLHTRVFTKYIDFLSGVNCKWIINIDTVCEENMADTVNNLLSLLSLNLSNYQVDHEVKILPNKGNLDVHIITNNSGGTPEHFYNSCQRVINESILYTPKFGYLLLEDDWEYIGGLKLSDIMKTPIQPYDYIQLVQRNSNILSFNPGIWGTDLWNDICYKKIQTPFSTSVQNPERQCVYPISETNTLVSNHMTQYLFYDVGRVWATNNSMYRTYKKHKMNK